MQTRKVVNECHDRSVDRWKHECKSENRNIQIANKVPKKITYSFRILKAITTQKSIISALSCSSHRSRARNGVGLYMLV